MPYKSPAYRWYPNDVLNSRRVGEMTAAEECWYRRALDLSWINEGIPSDPVKLARVIGKGCTKGGARVVLAMFQETDDPTRFVNDRQEVERLKQQEWSAKSSAGGKASAGKRKHPKEIRSEHGGSTKATANGQPKGNIPFPIPSPNKKSPNGDKAATEKPSLLPLDFEPTGEMLAWASRECPGLNLKRETEEFVGFWRDIALKNNKRTARGWNQTWKTRMRDRFEKLPVVADRAKARVGKSEEVEIEVQCKTCFDTGQVRQTPANPRWEWDVEYVPCPSDHHKERQANERKGI